MAEKSGRSRVDRENLTLTLHKPDKVDRYYRNLRLQL